MSRGLKVTAICATVIMYIVLQMGALVTNTGSGDGCGASWPLCKGTFMPEWDYAAIIEFSHRAVSGLAGLLTLILAVWAWRVLRERPLVRWLAVSSLALTTFQGLLGAAAVLWPQPKAVLALHFGISLLCFSAVLLVATLVGQNPDKPGPQYQPVDPALKRWVWFVALFSYGVIYLGAFVRHTRASLACLGWPLCNGELIPTLYGPVGAAFIHRVGAALAIIVVVRTWFYIRKAAPNRPDLQRGAGLLLFLVLLQAASGAVMVVGGGAWFNLLTQMLHSAIITLYWGALTFLCFRVLPAEAELVARPAPSTAVRNA